MKPETAIGQPPIDTPCGVAPMLAGAPSATLPVLSCAETAAFEERYFSGVAGAVRAAVFIRRAAEAVASEAGALFAELRRRPPRRILVAAGKGNNAADALLAARILARRAAPFYGLERNNSCAGVHVLLAEPSLEKWNRHARAALDALTTRAARAFPPGTWHEARARAIAITDGAPDDSSAPFSAAEAASPFDYDLLLDGILGYGFRPPPRGDYAALIHHLNTRRDILLRVSVDLPSGLGDDATEGDSGGAGSSKDCPARNAAAAVIVRADATVACGFVKSPLLRPGSEGFRGRLRLADIGFPRQLPDADTADAASIAAGRNAQTPDAAPRVRAATPEMLLACTPLAAPRPPLADKRHYGHALILGGERRMPGALLMNVQAALHAGCGLVTAFCPESVHAAFAAAAPEAMWVPWPETPEGALALEGEHLLREHLARATAFLCGSGTGAQPETRALLQSAAARAAARGIPVILDAGALQPEIVSAASMSARAAAAASMSARAAAAAPVILLPHAGEYLRVCNGDSGDKSGTKRPPASLAATAVSLCVHIALKGAPTRIAAPGGAGEIVVCGGSPLLARGGSGDVLAGIVAALFARADFAPLPPVDTLAAAVAWHALAADRAARHHGADSATARSLFPFLPFPAEM